MADSSRPGWLHRWGRTLLVSARWRARQGVRRTRPPAAYVAVPRARTSPDEDRPLTVEQVLTWSESGSHR